MAADPLDEPAPKDFAKFLDSCLEGFIAQNKAFAQKWGIDDCERWGVDQDRGTVTFVNTRKGHKKLVGKVQIVGSFDTADGSWLWGWANTTVRDPLKADARKLKAYGEKNRIARLVAPRWRGEEIDGWKLTALAVKLLGAEGAYRGPAGKLRIFMIIRDLKEEK
jgi:hypothetical protein